MRRTRALAIIALAVVAAIGLGSQAKESFAGGLGGRSGIAEDCIEKTCQVSMTGLRFSPDTLKIRPGATVVWTNNDKALHTITSRSAEDGKDPVFDSGIASPIMPGGDWERTFDSDSPGVFRYYCAIHPRMTGEIVVTGEPIEEFPRLAVMILAGAVVFGVFGVVAALYRRKK